MPLLEVNHLSVEFKIGGGVFHIVSDISFTIEEGKTLCLVGESGSGKSVTALSLLRLIQTPPSLPPKGEVLFLGKNLIECSERELRKIRGKEIAMIFQDPQNSLNPVFTIGNQLIETALCHFNISEEEAHKKSLDVLSSVGLKDPERLMRSYPHELSGGMNQRVMIAMALIGRPKLLIADEPTTALDVSVQAEILALLKELQKEYKMAILLITHDMRVVEKLGHDVLVMYGGRIVESAPQEVLFKSPQHPYTMGLFAAVNRDGEKGKLKTIPGAPPSIHHMPKGCAFHPRCPFAFSKCEHGVVPFFYNQENKNQKAACWLREKQ